MLKTSMKWNTLQLSVDSSSYEKQFNSGTKNVKRKMSTKIKQSVDKVKHSVMSVLSNCSAPDTLLICFMSLDF